MSRPQKIHKPIKGTFIDVLEVIATGSGADKNSHAKRPRPHHKSPEKSESDRPTKKQK